MVMLSKTSTKSRQGFTIVELLIVVVVIGILAAITLVTYSGIRAQAVQASLKSDLRNATAQIETDKIKTGAYPLTAALANDGAGLKSSPNTNISYINRAVDSSYCVAMIPTGGGVPTVHQSSRGGGVQEGPCAQATVVKGGVGGGCTPVACNFITVNTQNFVAATYSIQCIHNNAVIATINRALPSNGSTQLSCYVSNQGSNQVSVSISGWGQAEPIAW